jgi:hypothetical protein
MSLNPFKRLLGLLPQRPLQVGDVMSTSGGVATIQLPGGATAQARGDAAPGTRVFFRDGAIEGTAPSLPVEFIDV